MYSRKINTFQYPLLFFNSTVTTGEGGFESWISPLKILDTTLIANECLNDHLKSDNLWVLCKIDLKKNYDHVNWDFLIYLLQRCGFGGKKRKCIAFCISTFKFLILMNGIPSGFSIAMVAYVKEIPFPIIVCGGC